MDVKVITSAKASWWTNLTWKERNLLSKKLNIIDFVMDIKYEIKGKSNFKTDYSRHVPEYSSKFNSFRIILIWHFFLRIRSKILLYLQIL
jgi:hypothetical protein